MTVERGADGGDSGRRVEAEEADEKTNALIRTHESQTLPYL